MILYFVFGLFNFLKDPEMIETEKCFKIFGKYLKAIKLILF